MPLLKLRYAPPLVLVALLSISFTSFARADCGGLGPMGSSPVPNVLWSLKDSVTACPAGDSVLAGHPSRLRIKVYYADDACNAKVGVPPESIWVTTTVPSGNLIPNDQPKIFADDSTDALGITRVTIVSLSGCGTLRVKLYVTGVYQGYLDAKVRSTDTNGDGRTNSSDTTSVCDLNFSGAVNSTDVDLVKAHLEDSHRNALFGTLVRRTNLCGSCGNGAAYTIGDGVIGWSPNGTRLAYERRNASGHCAIMVVPSNPIAGNDTLQLSFPTESGDDYDPSWSPLGDQVVYGRGDSQILHKGVPGIASDTTETIISVTGSFATITNESVSPDANLIAFSGVVPTGHFHIYTVPFTGGVPKQITSGNLNEFYPEWSPDGKTIVFFRNLTDSTAAVYRVPADSGAITTVYAPASAKARLPHYSPDAAILTMSYQAGSAAPYTLARDTTISSSTRSIANYPSYGYATLTPKLSPDGTRLALLATAPGSSDLTPQMWAARRNMNLPPQFTSIGSQSVADTTASVSVSMNRNHTNTLVVSASDPESDPLTYAASFLTHGMSFSPLTRILTWYPTDSVGSTFNVKFVASTPSGGVDAIIARITVIPNAGPSRAGRPAQEQAEWSIKADSREGIFEVITPVLGASEATLAVFDVAGRRLARIHGRSGSALVWPGATASGARAPSGVYLYRVQVGTQTRYGKWLIAR
jgi:hypothetical protein